MDYAPVNRSWIWHPDWVDSPADSENTSGRIVDFRRSFALSWLPDHGYKIKITADTRYQLYVNANLVHAGPVKGDSQQWFYDEVDIGRYLQIGANQIVVRVLRLFHKSSHGVCFVRMPVPGLYICAPPIDSDHGAVDISTDAQWEASIDAGICFPTDLKDDDFLHIYEAVDHSKTQGRDWTSAKRYVFMESHGISNPWKLSERMIPTHRFEKITPKRLNNISSCISDYKWTKLLLGHASSEAPIVLPPGTQHHIEVELDSHATALLSLKFEKPLVAGSTVRIQYSECYENKPAVPPYDRRKGNRTDRSKQLFGPHDSYVLAGPSYTDPRYNAKDSTQEVFEPFHFRTFRVLSIDISVHSGSALAFRGIEATKTTYALDVLARFEAREQDRAISWAKDLWDISTRTLENCMHDTYEDCPFYEQLQYAMDTRSSILFTYCLSGDDRLPKQAIAQLFNSLQPGIGLTASRAPSHQLQIIPHFSLYWICMVMDHFQYFGDKEHALRYLSGINLVLDTFERKISIEKGLIPCDATGKFWDFVDWQPSWRPYGIPPAGARTNFLLYTNALYAYVLKYTADGAEQLGKKHLAEEYRLRAEAVVQAIQKHCFDGEYFTDGLASSANPDTDYSVHSQTWAILCGAAKGKDAARILGSALEGRASGKGPFERPSVAMAFYTLRALSRVKGLYEAKFHDFWQPWRDQVALNLTTWVEDDVCQRSDCHAWGSAPLFEFTTEVAGLSPLEPGYSALRFAPRIGLFPNVSATVPINAKFGKALVVIGWNRTQDETSIRLEIRGTSPGVDLQQVRTQVVLDGQSQDCFGAGPHTFLTPLFKRSE